MPGGCAARAPPRAPRSRRARTSRARSRCRPPPRPRTRTRPRERRGGTRARRISANRTLEASAHSAASSRSPISDASGENSRLYAGREWPAYQRVSHTPIPIWRKSSRRYTWPAESGVRGSATSHTATSSAASAGPGHGNCIARARPVRRSTGVRCATPPDPGSSRRRTGGHVPLRTVERPGSSCARVRQHAYDNDGDESRDG